MPDLRSEATRKLAETLTASPQTLPQNVEEARVEDRVPPGYDIFYLSAKEMKSYGINPETEDYAFVRNPTFWTQREGVDRVLEYQRLNPGAEAVLVNGHLVTNGDLALVKRPRKIREKIEAEHEQKVKERLREMNQGEPDDFDPTDTGRIRDRLKMTSTMERRSRLVGAPEAPSPTSGLTYEEAIRRIRPDSTIREDYISEYSRKIGVGKDMAARILTVKLEEARYRSGGRHVDQQSVLETIIYGRTGRRNYAPPEELPAKQPSEPKVTRSIPNNVQPKNLRR